MRRFEAWDTGLKGKLNKSLTIKSFLLLLLLLLFVSGTVYGFIGLFLSADASLGKNLEQRVDALISDLRKTRAENSGHAFTQFLMDTGAQINLINASREEVDLFTFSASVPSEREDTGLEYPFHFADSDEEYILLVQGTGIRSKQISEGIKRSLPWAGSLILLFSCTGAYFYSRYTTKPILRMSKIAGKIAKQDFSWYCPDLRKDEIGALAASLNEMSDQLNEVLSTLRRQNLSLEDKIKLEKEQERRRLLFFSAVSHEMKTPLAIVMGQLEGMIHQVGVYKDRDKYLIRASEVLSSLDRFVREILSIAQMDLESRSGPCGRVDLSSLLYEIAANHANLSKERNMRIVTDLGPGICLPGDKKLLEKALDNVVGNAVSHSPCGEQVTVQLTANDGIRVRVTNSGTQIPKEHLPRLFDAFYRVNANSGSGSGLGLYITQMILEAHNARFSITNCKSGVLFSILFPKSY